MNLRPVYALVGDDAASIQVRVDALKAAFVEAHGDLTVEPYDASTRGAPEVLGTLLGTSLLSGYRIVLVRSFEKWVGKAGDKGDEAVSSIASKYLTDPDPGTVLLLVGERFPKKTRAWKELAAAVKAQGKMLEYNMPREWDMAQWVVARAGEEGLSLSKAVAERLVSVAGTDSMTLLLEVRKISDYLESIGRKDATAADIDMLVVPRGHVTGFRVAESAISGRFAEAASGMDMAAPDQTAGQVSHAVGREVRLVSLVSSMASAGATDSAIKAAVKAGGFMRAEPSDWVLKKIKDRASRYSPASVAAAISSLAVADLALKGGTRSRYPERELMDVMLYEVSSAGRQGK